MTNMDWTDFTAKRRAARRFSPAAKPKRQSLVALARAWHVDPERLKQIILDYAIANGKVTS